MKSSYQHIPCVYFAASEDGFITDLNEGLCKCLQYTQAELLGKKLESIFTLSTRIFQQTHFYPLLQMKGHAEEIYITLKAKDGAHVPLLMNGQRLEENGRESFHFAGITVSKRKRFEEEIIAAKKAAEKALNENIALKAAKDELQQHAQKLDRQIALSALQNQELRQLNHLSTHTLQEPVRKLLFFYNEILAMPQDAAAKKTLLKIKKAADDIHHKLNGLQQFLWLTKEDLSFEKIALRDVLISAKSTVEEKNPGIQIQMEAEAIPTIEANPEQMSLLLQELLSNAVRFRKPGNLINVKVFASTLQLNEFRELPGKYKYSDYLKLQIRDDGIGFDDQYQEQAFELFRVLHPHSGLGVGLSLCKKVVENHGGSIALESQQDLSTLVILYLPLSQADSAKPSSKKKDT